jgi:hypothetical protein
MSRIVPKTEIQPPALDETPPGALDFLWRPPAPTGFFSFHYTVAELSARDGRTQVRVRRVSLDDGRLGSETFEAEIGEHAFSDAVREAQERVLSQWAALMNPFAWLLPAPRRSRDEEA